MIKQLRAEPGFSWNEDQNMVIANDAAWDAYIAVCSYPEMLFMYLWLTSDYDKPPETS